MVIGVICGFLVPGVVYGEGIRVMEALERVEAGVGSSGGEGMAEAMKELRAAVVELSAEAEAARQWAAGAQARLASHTGAYLSREVGKLAPSQRLVEMTRSTGRSSEVARYENRHRMLEESIDGAMLEYEAMIRELCTMSDERVQRGFAEYEGMLIDWGMAEQIRIHQVVKRQYEEYRKAGEADREQWKKELGA